MFTKYSSFLKRQWRQVSGALVVLLMFFVPATRAVLATSGEHHVDNQHNHDDKSQNCSRPTRSTPRPVSPVEPDSHKTTGARTGYPPER
jgi:hypothetical protein